MAIPSSIDSFHILRAIAQINTKGVPKHRRSKTYDLHYRNGRYPPKYVVSVGNKFANGIELHGFKVGRQTNNFLIARGFTDIWNKLKRERICVEAEEEDDAMAYEEGKISYALHRKLERNPKLAKKVKNKRLKEAGDLRCDVCAFSFQEQYGPVGIGFIEAHHTIPISRLKGRKFTRPEEIALVCSNCHRMLHRASPLPTIAELKKTIKKVVAAAAAK